MVCVPAQSQLTSHGSVQMHQDLLRLGSQKFQGLQWAFSPADMSTCNPAEHDERNAPSGYSSPSACLRDLNINSTGGVVSCCSEDVSSMRRQAGRWQTSICVPIMPPRTLQPSFCSHLIARSYSLLLHVSFGGAYTSKIDLRVPLQVAYPQPPILPLHTEGINSQQSQRSESMGSCCSLSSHVSFSCKSAI